MSFPSHLLHFYLPLVLIGAAAAFVQLLARRSAPGPRRRLLEFAWILILLAGGPGWVFLATMLGW